MGMQVHRNPHAFFLLPPSSSIACPSLCSSALLSPSTGTSLAERELSPGSKCPCLSVSSRTVATAFQLRERVVCPEPLKVWEGLRLPSPCDFLAAVLQLLAPPPQANTG